MDEPDLLSVPRFSVRVDVPGRITLGEPVELRVIVDAHLSTADVEIRVTLPEVETIRARRAGRGIPLATPMAPVLAERTTLGAGTRLERAVSVALPGPGLYRVIALAAKRSGEPVVSEGRPVQDMGVDERWIYVDEAGGRFADKFDAAVPDTVLAAPGLRRLKHGRGDPTRRPLEMRSPSSNPDCDEWLVTYNNIDAGTVEPLKHVFVDGTIVDNQYGTIVQYITTATDENGIFVVCNSDSWASYSGQVSAETHSVVFVSTAIAYFAGGYTVGAGQFSELAAGPSAVARTMVNIGIAAARSYAVFGFGRGQVEARVHADDNGSRYSTCPGFFGCLDDVITIHPGDVWTEWGIETTAHEFGHAMHEKALGGNVGGDCPKPHTYNQVTHLRCAFSEGFAEFHAAITRGPSLIFGSSGSDTEIERNSHLPSGADGSTVEGAVAAFFYDVVDGANEPDGPDNMPNGDDDAWQLGGNYLAQIIRTCNVYPVNGAGYWGRGNGADHLAYCMERLIDPAVRNSATYFRTRWPDPSSFNEAATEPTAWSQTAIRTLWLRNLYNEAFVPPPPPPPPPPEECVPEPPQIACVASAPARPPRK